MPFNKLILIIFLFLFRLNVYATEQISDILKYNGKKYEWKTFSPARKYFKEKGFTPPKEAIETSANVGSFIYEYEIIDHKFYLSDVIIIIHDKNENIHSKSVFNLYFPMQTRFLMSEISGILFIPYGKEELIEYKKEEWSEYYYPNYLIFQIDNGNIIKNYDLDYDDLQKFQKKQFNQFKKTNDYKIALIKEKENYKFHNKMRPENLQVSFDEYLKFKILSLIKRLK